MATESRWGAGVWGTFVWNDIAPVPRKLTWLIDVDWDNDTYFSGENEAFAYDATGAVSIERLLIEDDTRGRQFFIKTDGTGFEPFDTGIARLEMKDLEGRYNPYNTSSPIYAYLLNNCRISIRLQDESTGIVYPVFFGFIDDVRPNFSPVLSTASIYASDGFSRLKNINVTRQDVFTTFRFSAAIDQVLRDFGWMDGKSIDTTDSNTMPFWWESSRLAMTELQDLADAAFAAFFIGRSGLATYLSNIATDSSVGTLTEDDIEYDYGIQAYSPRDALRNYIQIFARARKAQNLAVLWTAIDKPSIAAGNTLEVWANFSFNAEQVPATSITTPVATTDYTANTAPDGSGSDKTSSVAITLTRFATSAKLSIKNNDAGTVYITLLQLRGICITADPYTFSLAKDDASIAQYTQRNLVIQTDWIQDINSAIDRATTLKLKLSLPRQFPRVKIKKSSLAKSGMLELQALVDINFPSKQISDELRVGYLHHSWDAQEPNIWNTVVYFEPNLFGNASGTWIFPALIGTTTKFA